MSKELGDRFSPYSEWGDLGPGLREARDIERDAGDAAAAAHQEASAASAAAYAVAYAEAAAKAKAEAEQRRKQEDESDVGDRFDGLG